MMRYHIERGIVGFCCLIILIFIAMVSDYNGETTTNTQLRFVVGDEIIEAYEQENTYYLFLPSYANLQEVTLNRDSFSFYVPSADITITPKTSLKDFIVGEEISCTNMETNSDFSLCVMQSANLPSMFITTASGSLEKILEDKEYEEKGQIKVVREDGTTDCSMNLKGISGRGNYSWAKYEKKPFSFSVKDSTSILGLASGYKWVLISNASDPTFIRNELVRGMEKAMNVTMSMSGTFVDLYINGEYNGNYYLSEKIEVGEERVNITNLEEKMNLLYKNQNMDNYPNYESENLKSKVLDYNPDDITGGYLIEREFENRYREEYGITPSSFITDEEEHFIIQSPKYCSQEQIQYISDFVGEAEAALMAPDGIHPETQKDYSDYIDVESFVKKYLIEEVSKNYDGGVSSSFFYKDSDTISSLLHAGPGWDYDMSLGNYLDWMEYFSKDPMGVSKLSQHFHASPWYEALYAKEETLIKDMYQEYVAQYLVELTENTIDMWQKELEASARMDYIRWEEIYQENTYYVNREQSFADLKSFITKRKEYLDSVWIHNKSYHTVQFIIDGSIEEIRYIEDGQSIGVLPVTMYNGKVCYRWKQEGTGQYVTGDDSVEQDLIINGVFQTEP